MIKAKNKGEWSEFYAFLKILSDRKLFAADSKLEKIPDKFYNVLSISREETKGSKIIYDLISNPKGVSISVPGDQVVFVDGDKLKNGVKQILEEILNAPKGPFVPKSANEFMPLMHCAKVKSSSSKKEDINIKIEDRIASVNTELGFSIKSKLGGSPSLLNASSHTNFIYCTESEKKVNEHEMVDISGNSKMRDKINSIKYNLGNLYFEKMESAIFKNNLSFIDSQFSKTLAEMILISYETGAREVNEIVNYMEDKKIIIDKLNSDTAHVQYNVKEFLLAVALGMTPGKPWAGEIKAHGGYIVVKKDGDVVCYNLYNREDFKEYLYINTYFDTPDPKRHKFGNLYSDGDKKCIKFNFQIRFKK